MLRANFFLFFLFFALLRFGLVSISFYIPHISLFLNIYLIQSKLFWGFIFVFAFFKFYFINIFLFQ